MKALVLNGSITEKSTVNTVPDYLVDCLKTNKYETDVMVLRKEKIAGCLGCFGCFLKTPGKCVINDAGSDLPRKVMQSDVVLCTTPVTFGMHSSELKKAIERFACPILLPYLEKISGEVHHSKRYDKYPTFVVIGVPPSPDEESETAFKNLASRNALNLHTTFHSGIIYSTDAPDAIEAKIDALLSNAGVL
jgi:multimeric flavodoxin WrbA